VLTHDKTVPVLHIQVTPINLIQYQQFVLHRIDIIFTYEHLLFCEMFIKLEGDTVERIYLR